MKSIELLLSESIFISLYWFVKSSVPILVDINTFYDTGHKYQLLETLAGWVKSISCSDRRQIIVHSK